MLLRKHIVFNILFLNIIGVLSYKNSSLTFIIDDTGSMTYEIEQVKNAAINIINIVNNKHSSVVDNVVLVTFNDPGKYNYYDSTWGPCDNSNNSARLRTITNSGKEFKDTVSNIRVNGGGDNPECSLSGIKLGLENSHPESCIFVFTDDDAKDKTLLNDVKRIAQIKQSQVVIALTTKGCPKYDTYLKIAEATHGQVFCLGSRQLDGNTGIFNYVSECVKGGSTVLNDTTIYFKRQYETKKFHFTVDERTDYVLISATGKQAQLLHVRDNSHAMMHNIQRTVVYQDSKVIKFNPTSPGGYYVEVSGNSYVRITVYGKTDFTFDYGFFKPKTPSDVVKQPVAGEEYFLKISVTDISHGVDIQTVKILSETKETLADIPLLEKSRDIYNSIKVFRVPPGLLTIVVTGFTGKTEGQATPIDRKSRTAVSPIIPDPEVDILEGSVANVDYNGEIALTCNVISFTTPNLSWTTTSGRKLEFQILKPTYSVPPFKYRALLNLKHVINAETFICKARNNFEGATDVTKIIEVRPGPTIHVTDQHTEITKANYGDDVKIRCGFVSSSPFEIIWTQTRNGIQEKITNGLSRDNKELTIKSVNLNDHRKKITCEATLISNKKIRKQLSTTVVIINLAPPSIINKIPNRIVVSVNDSATINCKSVGVPHPKVSLKVKREGDNKFIDLPISSEEYVIRKATLANAGQYKCIAENDQGRDEHTNVLIVQQKPVITITDGPQRTVPYGSTNELSCMVEAYPQPTTFTWKDGKGNILKSNNDIKYGSSVSRVNVLAKSNETYICYAENRLGNTESRIKIEVSSPFVVKPTDTTYAHYGKPKDLTCNISSKYPFSIKWFFNYGSPKATEIHTSGKYTVSPNGFMLHIKSVDLNNDGRYTCEATLISDGNERAAYAVNMQIDDLAPPSIINKTPNQIVVSTNDRATIYCKAVGVPHPKVSLKVKREGDNKFIDLPISSEEYVIRKATLANAGQYKCIAENDQGRDEHTNVLIVQQKPVITITDGPLRTVPYGSTNELSCMVEAYPQPTTFTWKDGKGNILKSVNNDIKYGSSVSRVNVLAKSNETYICYAENRLGNTESRIKIEVSSPFVVKPTDTTYAHYGKPKDLTCNISSKYPFSIKWFFNYGSPKATEIHTSGKYTVSPNGFMLHIKSVDLNNDGRYTCEATLISDGNERAAYAVNMQIDDLAPPSIINKTPNQIVVSTNDRATIYCKAVGVPHPKVSLKVKREGDNKFIDLPISSEEYVIRKATLANAGQYKCIAENDQGRDEHTNVLIVQQKPVITITDGPLRTVPYGSTNELSCMVEAYPQPTTFTWKDGKGNILKSVNNDIKYGSSVSRVNVLAKSNETYICYAENRLGNTESRIKIEVSSPFVVKPTDTTYAHYGKPKDLTCNISSKYPFSIKWFFNYGSPKATEIHTSGKYTVSPNGFMLHIKSVDLNNDGRYTCEASLISDGNERAAFTTNVQIDDIEHPEIISLELPSKIRKSQTFQAKCRAIGNPKPLIYWQFKEKDSMEYVNISGKEYLEIRDVGYENAGFYKCLASNINGTITRTSSVVTVEGAPSITNTDSVYYGVTGDKVLKIPCDVTGYPQPSITWKSKNTIITEDTKLFVKDNALYIKNPNEKDTKEFTCEAINPLGNDTKTFNTLVEDSPYAHFGNNNRVDVVMGKSIGLNCTLNHSEADSIRWYVNGQNTSNHGHVYLLKNVTTLNDGNYTCRVSTDEGTQSLNFEVDVGYEPTFKNFEYNKIINWYGEDDIINCDVVAKPFETAEWYYNDEKIEWSSSQYSITKWGTYTCRISNVHGHVERTFKVTNVEACIINQMADNTPNTPLLIFNETSSAWPILKNQDYEVLAIKRDQNFILACNTEDQPENEYITSKAKTLQAKCYMEDTFIVEGKELKFNDIQCKNVVKHSVVSTDKKCFGSKGSIVEVGFKRSQFLKMYDVCISNNKKVFYTKMNMSESNVGNIDPIRHKQTKPEYNNSCDGKSECCYKDGQFVNTKDVAFGPAQTATYADIYNIVPVWQPCKNNRNFTWTQLEDFLRKELGNWKSMQVWSGGSHYTGPIPRYLWKIVKMEQLLETIVYVNDPAPKEADILCSEEANIFTQADKNFKDKFTYTCSIEDFANAMHIDLSTFDDDIKLDDEEDEENE